MIRYTNIAVVSANMGHFDKNLEHVPQSIDYDCFKFTDENFPPRHCSMTSRLQARIPKAFSWQMIPGYDYYLWIDSSCILSHVDSIKWFLEKLDDADISVFKHPNRNTIQEECDYLKKRLKNKCPYITPRYENERLDEQMTVIKSDKDFVDDHLFASTSFIYKNSEKTQKMLTDWWHHISLYHSIDQLSFPYVIWKSGCKVNVIPDKYMEIPYLKYVRK